MPETISTVDAHQHYWQLHRFTYPWNRQINLPAMNRDYLPEDILPEMQKLGVQSTVLIQADESLEETAWMLELAERYPHIAGVVGWANLAAPDVAVTLEQMQQNTLFKGIRLMSPPQADWQTLSPGLNALATLGLTCDLLLDEITLSLAIETIRTHPQTRFIINHCAGLPLVPGGAAAWTLKLKPLAELPNVLLKFSAIQGLAEPPPITLETLRPHLESALTLFGAKRLIFASDWPVSTLSGPYPECIQLMRQATASLSPDEQASIWGMTAAETYKLGRG